MGVHVRQPQIARINWNNPLTRGMNFCAVGGQPIDLVTNARGTLAGTVTIQPEKHGKVFRTASGAANRLDFTVNKDIAGSAYSFASINTSVTNGSFQYLLFRELAGVNGGTINLLMGVAAGRTLQISFGTSGSLYGNIAISDNVWYTMSGSTPDDGDIQATSGSLFINGRKDTLNTTVSGAVQASTSTNMSLNGRPSDNNRQLNGAQALSVSWHRHLSDAEHIEFAKNPWAIFVLDDSRTYNVPSTPAPSIAFSSKTGMTTGSSSTPTSASHTAAAGDILWFGVTTRSTRTITAAPVWNGQTMTLSGSTSGTSGITNSLYYLSVVTGGTATVSCTQSASDNWAVGTISFTGAKTTGIPDATSVGGPTAIGAGYSQSVTSVADNCFAVMYGNNNSGAALTGGSNTTIANQPEVAFTGAFLAYSTAAKTPAGTFPLAFTSASGTASCCMASFAPNVSTATNRQYSFVAG